MKYDFSQLWLAILLTVMAAGMDRLPIVDRIDLGWPLRLP